MIERRCRPPTVLDLLIFVVATAAGISAMPSRWWIYLKPIWSQDPHPWAAILILFFRVSPAVWFAWTIGVVLIRLRRPRPSLRRLGRQPGFVGCLAAHIVQSLEWVFYFVEYLAGGHASHSLFEYNPASPFRPCMAAVAGAWLTLQLSGRWRPELGWIDRLGRRFCLAWITADLANAVMFQCIRWADFINR